MAALEPVQGRVLVRYREAQASLRAAMAKGDAVAAQAAKETIESLQIGLEKYPGTLVFVSHDREFVGALANRIIEIRAGGKLVDFRGNYDDYLKSQGIEV